ncbi:MAG: TCP-1/cpn60 chaperonin family protein, partial [Paraclostridium sp.]
LANTFGPFGATSVIDQYPTGRPKFTKDGLDLLMSIKLNGPVENNVLEMVREMATNQVLRVGDGSTSTIISASEMYNQIMELKSFLKKNDIIVPTQVFINAYKKAKEFYMNGLLEKAKPISDDLNELNKIASIALNNDEEVGNIIGDAYSKAGINGEVLYEKKSGAGIEVEAIDGIKLGYGYLMENGYNNKEKLSNVLKDPTVLIFSQRIEGTNYTSLFVDILNYYMVTQKPLVIIAHGLGDSAMTHVDTNFARFMIENINIVEFPQNLEMNIKMARDLAMVCGGKVIDKDLDPGLKMYVDEFYTTVIDKNDKDYGAKSKHKVIHTPFSEAFMNYMGSAEEVESTKGYTVVKGGKGLKTNSEEIAETKANLTDKLKAIMANRTDKDNMAVAVLKNRLAALDNKMVKIYVGGDTEQERDATYALIDDAVKATRSALKNGYIIGGNYAVLSVFDSTPGQFTTHDICTKSITEIAESWNGNLYTDLDKICRVVIAKSFFNMISRVYENGY